MYTLQTSVEIDGASFGIRNKGDFRMVLDCFKALNDEELSPQERVYASLIIFYEDFNSIEDLLEYEDILNDLQKEMYLFFDNAREDIQSNTSGHNLVDWDKDSSLICSAINNVANQEIRSLEYLHWWTFLGYYMAIGECLFSYILDIRYKMANGEKLEKYEKKFRDKNPHYFNIDMRTSDQKQADEYVRQLWGDS